MQPWYSLRFFCWPKTVRGKTSRLQPKPPGEGSKLQGCNPGARYDRPFLAKNGARKVTIAPFLAKTVRVQTPTATLQPCNLDPPSRLQPWCSLRLLVFYSRTMSLDLCKLRHACLTPCPTPAPMPHPCAPPLTPRSSGYCFFYSTTISLDLCKIRHARPTPCPTPCPTHAPMPHPCAPPMTPGSSGYCFLLQNNFIRPV